MARGQTGGCDYVVLMQISTVIYFAFFLVAMPVLGLVETPRRLPNSITEAVLSATARNRDSASTQDGERKPAEQWAYCLNRP